MIDKLMYAIEMLLTIFVAFLTLVVMYLGVAVWWTEYIFIAKLIMSALCVAEVLFSVYVLIGSRRM